MIGALCEQKCRQTTPGWVYQLTRGAATPSVQKLTDLYHTPSMFPNHKPSGIATGVPRS